MVNGAIICLLVVAALAGLVFYWKRQARKDGRNEQEVQQQREVINNVEKAKGARTRLDDDKRDKLHDRYRK